MEKTTATTARSDHSVVFNFDSEGFDAELRGDTAEVTGVDSHGDEVKIHTLRAAAFDRQFLSVTELNQIESAIRKTNDNASVHHFTGCTKIRPGILNHFD